jgi:hypothetical protein
MDRTKAIADMLGIPMPEECDDPSHPHHPMHGVWKKQNQGKKRDVFREFHEGDFSSLLKMSSVFMDYSRGVLAPFNLDIMIAVYGSDMFTIGVTEGEATNVVLLTEYMIPSERMDLNSEQFAWVRRFETAETLGCWVVLELILMRDQIFNVEIPSEIEHKIRQDVD